MEDKKLTAISEHLSETRAATAATNLVLTAMASLMDRQQFELLLSRVAADSAEKQRFVEQSGTPEAARTVRRLQEAEERLVQTLRQAFAHHNPPD